MVKRCYGCMMTYEDYNGTCPHCGYVENTVPENAMHLMPGVILNNRFIVGKVVGYGGFGVTYLGWDKLLAQKVAIKEYLPSEFSTRAPGNTFVTIFDGDKKEQFNSGKFKFVEEAKKLAKFTDCQGIVKVFDSFIDNDTAYIVMEYVDGVTLEEYLKERQTIPADEAVLMMLPVIDSLHKVHESGVIHRDIAPNNIMVAENGDVKVIDFGAARFATATHTKSMTVIIKPGYSPEEQYMSRGDQGPHTDVYAVGATLYTMITGVVPPDAMERRAQFQAKGKDILEPISKYNKDISKNLENAIMNSMNVEIDKRTPDMATFMYELTTDDPVARRNGKIKITDVYRWPIWLKVTIPAVAMLVLTLSVLFSMGIIGFDKNLNEEMKIPEGMVQVPWVVNKTQEEASLIMNNRQLLMVTSAGDYSDDIEAGMVMKQETTGGAPVLANSRVYVTLSRGKELKTIPASVALYADAQVVKATLEELGFYATINVESEYSNIPAGLVTALATESGQEVKANDDLPKGTVILITASKGLDPNAVIEEKKVKVPNFIGITKQAAYELAGTEIKIEIEDRYNKDYEPGIIWYQSVDAETEIDNTVTITLYASVSNMVKVPNVIGINYKDAIKELEAVGFEYKLNYKEHENYAKDIVFEQSHEQGTMLEAGTVINLTVSKGASKQDVPSVVGMEEAVAKDTLAKAGFAVKVNYANSDSVAVGNVISQDIVGTKVAVKGDTITLTVSSGEKLFTVPDVVGKDEDTAKEMIKDAGFAVEVYSQYDDYAAYGEVIAQSEKAGISIKKGTKILITVSLGHEHNWKDATCTNPETCTICGETSGKALGHNYSKATCTDPATCIVCKATNGSALGHSWKNATCTTAKTCTVCGKTEGLALGHNWNSATCTMAKTCKTCGKTEGSTLAHNWNSATCTTAKTCKTCGKTEGSALGHSWNAATCTTAKTCKTCGTTSGNALGHSWNAATCTNAKTCKTCGATSGSALGHSWSAATCTKAKTCKICGATSGSTLPHQYDSATDLNCNTCGYVRGYWSEWSSWSTTKPATATGREITERVVDVQTTVKEYRYHRYVWYNSSGVQSSSQLPPSGYTYSSTISKGSKTYRNGYSSWHSEANRVECVWKQYREGEDAITTYYTEGITYYTEESRDVSATVQQTQYSYREIIYY